MQIDANSSLRIFKNPTPSCLPMSKSHAEAVSPHLKWWSAWQIIARARRSSILRRLPVFFPGEDLRSRTRRWDKINTYQRYIMLFLSNMYRIRQTHNAATYSFRLFRCAWKILKGSVPVALVKSVAFCLRMPLPQCSCTMIILHKTKRT